MKRLWIAIAVSVFAAVSLGVPGAIFRAIDALKVDAVEVPLDVLDTIDASLADLAGDSPQPRDHEIAFLGDSMIVSYSPGRDVPWRLQEALDHRSDADRFRVHTVAAPGMGPFDFYFIADRVAAAGPDQVILPFNLAAISPAWRNTFSRPQLAGGLPGRRIPQALFLPLDWIGMTADRLLGYFAVVQLGCGDAWHRLSQEQARLGGARQALALFIGKRYGSDADGRFAQGAFKYFKKRFNEPKTQRLTLEATEDRFEQLLAGVRPDDPTLELLAAAIGIFRERDVDVLVYVSPINIEHLEAVGAANPVGMARSLASIEHAATEAGARFVDLHALLPDGGFRDGAGHLSISDDRPDGPFLLAEQLAPHLVEQANQRDQRD